MSSPNELGLEEKFKLVADTIRCYPAQLKQAWDEISRMNFPDNYKEVDNIVFCGMGGSALGARMVDSLDFNKLRVPLKIVNEYNLPNYVSKKTLVIVSSYSGTTEETLEATFEAIKKGAMVFGITTGGKLAEILKKDNIPSYIFDPINNPSLQPRMSIGYACGAILALLTKLGFSSYSKADIEEAVIVMHELLTEFHENAPSDKNLAKSYALKLKNSSPIFVSSEHLFGTAYTVKNQFNESAKTFSDLFSLPELNHHLMEGLKYPKKLREVFTFFFINSKLYSEKIQLRYKITAEVVEKNGFSHLMYSPRSNTKLTQVFETLIFVSFVVYFLTKELNTDPLEIPWVDYFKEKLSKK